MKASVEYLIFLENAFLTATRPIARKTGETGMTVPM
jgi:hypothetical protein